MDIEFADDLGDVPEDIKQIVRALTEQLAPLFEIEAEGPVVGVDVNATAEDLAAMDEAWAKLDPADGWSPIPPSQWHLQPGATVVPLTERATER